MSWHRICDLTELAPESAREFVIGPRIVAVFHTREGVYAIDGMCAHQGGPIAQGQLDGQCVTCPWHGWQYNVTNGKNLLTDKRMLDCYPSEIRDGSVWIEIEG